MAWIREGTVEVTQGAVLVKGTGTFWNTKVEQGDMFTILDGNGLPTGPIYEVDRLVTGPKLDDGSNDPYYDATLVEMNPNRRMVLKQAYQGTSGALKAYAIINATGEMTTPRSISKLINYTEVARNLNSKPNVTAQPNGIPMADGAAKIDSAWIKDATDTVKGVVELATSAETQTGTADVNDGLAVTPAGALALLRKYGLGATTPAHMTHYALTDWDTFTTTGVYSAISGPGLNAPDTSSLAYTVIVSGYASTTLRLTQLALKVSAAEAYYRALTSSGWTPWVRLLDSAGASAATFAVTSTNDATSATAAPLKSAGGLAVAKKVYVGATSVTSTTGGINLGDLKVKAESFTLDAGATKEIQCLGGMVYIYVPSTGFGGLFFLDYANSTATRLAGIGEITDTGSTFALLGTAASSAWQLKNKAATATVYRTFTVNV